jgi:hypothetical protein
VKPISDMRTTDDLFSIAELDSVLGSSDENDPVAEEFEEW